MKPNRFAFLISHLFSFLVFFFSCSFGSVAWANQAPNLPSKPILAAFVGKTLSEDFVASDPDNNTVSFQVSGLPSTASFTGTGYTRTLEWTPTLQEVGVYVILITLKDTGFPEQSTSKSYTILVSKGCVVDKDCKRTQGSAIDLICVNQVCKLPLCFQGKPCAAGTICLEGNCINDPCIGKNCPVGQYCHSISGVGQCVSACNNITCTSGTVCQFGICTTSTINSCQPTCPSGKICIKDVVTSLYKCVDDECGQSDSCRPNRICLKGECKDDLCSVLSCPTRHRCEIGACVAFEPKITSQPGTKATEDSQYTYSPTTADFLPLDTFTWTFKTSPIGATIHPTNGKVEWTPGDADVNAGTRDFEIEVCNQINLCTTQKWTVTVTNINDAPVITSTAPTKAVESQLYTYNPTIQDPDPNDSHTYTLAKKPTGATIDATTGEINWTPGPQWSGVLAAFELKVCDKVGACDTQVWSVNTTNVNNPPQITSTAPTTAIEDKLYVYLPTVQDLDTNETFLWSLEKGPTTASIDATTGKIQWTPKNSDVGILHSFEIKVCDNASACDTQTWTVTVTNTNDAPVITSTAPDTARELTLYEYSPTATDDDVGDTQTWSFVTKPTGATIDATTGKIQWTPNTNQGGQKASFEIKVCDKAGACATQKFDVNVKNGNKKPTIVSTPTTSVNENDLYVYQAVATDPDTNDTQTWKLKSGPTGATLSSTGKVEWQTNSGNVNQTESFEIEVCDKEGDCDTQTWSVTVLDINDAPLILGTPPTSMFVGDRLSYHPTVKDPDTKDKHTWKLNKAPQGATIDSTTGQIEWIPQKADATKTVEFEVEVCDNGTPVKCAKQTFQIRIQGKCFLDSDCATGFVCVSGLCKKEQCVSSSNCPQGQLCLNGQCQTNPCLVVGSCANGEYCNPATGTCEKPCAQVTCTAGQICQGGVCIALTCSPSCASNEVCDETTDPTHPKCVQNPCTAGSCKAGRVCAPNGLCVDDLCPFITCPSDTRCVANQCVALQGCKVDADCPTDEICSNGKCIPSGCNKSNCTGNKLCINGKCELDPCKDSQGNSICNQTGEYCLPTLPTGTCVKSCSGVTCPSGQLCVGGVCLADPCSAITCNAGEICINGLCQSEACSVQNPCKFGRICVQNRCVDDPCKSITCPDVKQVCVNGQCLAPPACLVDSDCPTTQICVGGKCTVPVCQKDADCSTGELCENGKCKNDPCKNITCPAGQFCNSGQCQSSCAGVFCAPSEICVNGQCTQEPCHSITCNSNQICVNGVCIESKCQTNSNCKDGRICINNQCVNDPCQGISCPSGQTCQGGQCIGTLPCQLDSNCPSGSICVKGSCVPEGCLKKNCLAGELCVGGQCIKNPCQTIKCSAGEFCNSATGQCDNVCPLCPQGKICVAGQCVDDLCNSVSCPQGEKCEKGQCVKDICLDQAGNPCKHGRICKDGKCEEDPCLLMTCPANYTCQEGACQPISTPQEEVLQEGSSSEKVMDGSEKIVVEEKVVTDGSEKIVVPEEKVITDGFEKIVVEEKVVTDGSEVVVPEEKVVTDGSEVVVPEEKVVTDGSEKVVVPEEKVVNDNSTNDSTNDRRNGATFISGGCGCSTDSSGTIPFSALFVFFLAVSLRKRKK